MVCFDCPALPQAEPGCLVEQYSASSRLGRPVRTLLQKSFDLGSQPPKVVSSLPLKGKVLWLVDWERQALIELACTEQALGCRSCYHSYTQAVTEKVPWDLCHIGPVLAAGTAEKQKVSIDEHIAVAAVNGQQAWRETFVRPLDLAAARMETDSVTAADSVVTATVQLGRQPG